MTTNVINPAILSQAPSLASVPPTQFAAALTQITSGVPPFVGPPATAATTPLQVAGQTAAAPVVPVVAVATTSGTKWGAWICLIIGIIILLVAIVFLVVRRNSTDSKWWIWLLLAIGIVLIIISIFLFIY